MPNLLDSSHIDALPASIRQLAKSANLPKKFSLRQFIEKRGPSGTCVIIHLKILAQPNIAIGQMLLAMRSVYAPQDIAVHVASRENLSGSQFTLLLDIDVGPCMSSSLTTDQIQLFQNRNGAAADEPVIYFIETINGVKGKYNGCAAHAANQPAALVSNFCSRWTVAHEIGHILGLGHVPNEQDKDGNCVAPDFTRLMTGCDTTFITGTPNLTGLEVTLMNNSSFSKQC